MSKTIPNSPILKAWLSRSKKFAELAERESFSFEDAVFEKAAHIVAAHHPNFNQASIDIRAALQLLLAGHPGETQEPEQSEMIVDSLAVQLPGWVRKWAIAVLILLGVIAFAAIAKAEPEPTNAVGNQQVLAALRGNPGLFPALGGGIVIQVKNQGTTLQTRGGGLVVFNCSTNMSCSWSGSTFTLTASSSAGSAFSSITSGTNTTASMLVGTGASLGPTGSGAITSTAFSPAGTNGNCVKWGAAGALGDFGAACGTAATLQTGGSNNSSQTTLNFQNGSAAFGLTVAPSNPSGGNEQMALTGTLALSGATVPGSNGQLLFNNSGNIGAEDPIVSYAYVNLFNAAAATSTQTSSTVRVSTFGQYGELIATWASITGSPSGCTLQLKSADSLGNLTNNGSAVAVTAANGTSAILFTPSIFTAAQMAVVYSCSIYPSAGTLSLDFVPSVTVYSAQGPAASLSGAWPTELTDGTHGPAAVKAANVGAVGGDPALVVAISPNNVPGTNQLDLASVALGAPSNYGTSPGAVEVAGVNAFVTNTPSVQGTAAVGATASGNPLQDGCIFNTSPSTLTNGQMGALQCDSTQHALVNIGQNNTVDIQGHASAALDSPFGSSPAANGIQPAALAATTALPTAVSSGQDVQPMSDPFGRQVVLPQAPRGLIKTTGGVQTTNATQATLLAAQGAGIFADLVFLDVGTETGTACTVALTDGTNTYKVDVAATVGAGRVWTPAVPLPAASANTAWQVTGCASVTLDYTAWFVLNK